MCYRKGLQCGGVVIHDEQETREVAVSALRAAGFEAIGFEDPMAALDAFDADCRILVVVTRVVFPPGKPNGVAIARMVRNQRPSTAVVFVARCENAKHTEGLGAFVPMPLEPRVLVETVKRLLPVPE
jgi:DNA-binding NtrC family response regulator